MLVRSGRDFLAAWENLPAKPWGPATPRAVMLMAPEGLASTAATAADNHYMSPGRQVDPDLAHAQHRQLAHVLSRAADGGVDPSRALPVWTFPGDARTPDATFLNNAFATVPGRLVLGAMRYRQRQRETARADVRRFFTDLLGHGVELQGKGIVAELTGSLVIDRRRGGPVRPGQALHLAGAQALHHALGLRLTFAFDLAQGDTTPMW